jgi:hypothetical protein
MTARLEHLAGPTLQIKAVACHCWVCDGSTARMSRTAPARPGSAAQLELGTPDCGRAALKTSSPGPRSFGPGDSKNCTRHVQCAQGSLLFLSAYLFIFIELFLKSFNSILIPISDISSTSAVLDAKYFQPFGSAQVLLSDL